MYLKVVTLVTVVTVLLESTGYGLPLFLKVVTRILKVVTEHVAQSGRLPLFSERLPLFSQSGNRYVFDYKR